jgi:hypothetical protein
LRAEYEWLKEFPAQAAQQVFAELDLAFQRFWLGLAGYPPRKKKGRSHTVLRLPQGCAIRRLHRTAVNRRRDFAHQTSKSFDSSWDFQHDEFGSRYG